MKNFDPNQAATEDSGIFGLPYGEKESKLIFLPIPWEVTTSYRGGTSFGPEAVFNASKQVDLYDLDLKRPYEAGLFYKNPSKEILVLNQKAKKAAQFIIQNPHLKPNAKTQSALKTVNEASQKLNKYVYTETKKILNEGKIPGLIGGDHSVPLGAFHALSEKVSEYGILHIDAHSDTRNAYEGFQYSHASIMNNALSEVSQIKKLVQVGIRDFCEEEVEFIESQGRRMNVFYDRNIQKQKLAGKPFSKITNEILRELPKNVWVSFDIDGLDPRFCPNTGTPVPGGLDYSEVLYLIEALGKSGKKILGFDLNEVSPGEPGDVNLEKDSWDAIVGARILYLLAGWTLYSFSKNG